jgi:hypothetical protein
MQLGVSHAILQLIIMASYLLLFDSENMLFIGNVKRCRKKNVEKNIEKKISKEKNIEMKNIEKKKYRKCEYRR